MTPYYQDELVTLYHGDCLTVLPQLPAQSASMMLVDPPYGVTQNEWDTMPDLEKFWNAVRWICSGAIVMTARQPFSSMAVMSNLAMFKWEDIWKKTQATGHLNAQRMPMRQHENILVFGNDIVFNPQLRTKPAENVRPETPRTKQSTNYGHHPLERRRTIPMDQSYPSSIVEFANCQDWQHPTQKPIDLFKYLLLTYSNAGDMVADPYCGAGTTLVAAKQLHRNAIGIEIEERYCEISARRLTQEMSFAANAMTSTHGV